jgi:N-glycosylase/DNA lyase
MVSPSPPKLESWLTPQVWQIAQRDYKFGKGKHSSLTKATYDAIANRFRALWGKEAGWAHSVLFTADLKTFSSRLVVKVEETTTAQVVVKTEGETVVKEESTVKTVTTKRIKAEPNEGEEESLQTEVQSVRKVKRRKKA